MYLLHFSFQISQFCPASHLNIPSLVLVHLYLLNFPISLCETVLRLLKSTTSSWPKHPFCDLFKDFSSRSCSFGFAEDSCCPLVGSRAGQASTICLPQIDSPSALGRHHKVPVALSHLESLHLRVPESEFGRLRHLDTKWQS